jgi:hypothetical protein
MKHFGSFILLFSLTLTTSCTFKNYDSARTNGYHDDLYRNYQDGSRESVQVSNNLIATPDNYSLGYRDGISDGVGLGVRNIYTNNYFPFYYNWNFGLGYYWDPFLFRYGRGNYFWNFNNPWSFGWSNPWHWNYYSNPWWGWSGGWWGYPNFCGPYYRDWRWAYNPIYRQNSIYRQGPRTTFGSSRNLYQYRRSLEGNSPRRAESSSRRSFFGRGSSTTTNTNRNLSYSRSTERESRNTATNRISREYTSRPTHREAPTTSSPRTPRTYTPSYTPSTPRRYTPSTPRSYTPSTPRTYTPSYTPSTPRSYTPSYTPSTPRTYTPRTYTPSTPRTYTPRTYTPSTPRTYTPSYTPSRTSPVYRSRD